MYSIAPLPRQTDTWECFNALEVQKPLMTVMTVTLGSWTHTTQPLSSSFWGNSSMSYVLERKVLPLREPLMVQRWQELSVLLLPNPVEANWCQIPRLCFLNAQSLTKLKLSSSKQNKTNLYGHSNSLNLRPARSYQRLIFNLMWLGLRLYISKIHDVTPMLMAHRTHF